MTAKIVLLFIALIAVLVVATLFPRGWLARFLNLWYGPIPRDGERKSALLFRWAWYGCKWTAAFAAAFAVVTYLLPPMLGLRDPTEHHALFVFFFAFPFLFGTAALGTLVCLLGGAWLRLVRKDPTFNVQANAFGDNT